MKDKKRHLTILPIDYFGQTKDEHYHYALRRKVIDNRVSRHDLELEILDAVSAAFCIHISDITGRSRVKAIAEARHAYMSILRNVTNLTLVQVGSLMGRDHSTVINSCNTASDLLETDRAFAQRYRNAIQIVQENLEQHA